MDGQKPYRYGWKIHLTLPHDPEDPGTKKVVHFCKERGLLHKVGEGGRMEEGKGVTIYVGSRDRLENIAHAIHSAGLAPIEAMGEVLETDTRVIGNVWARFDPHDLHLNEGMQIRPFHKYGARGISFQTSPIIFYDPASRIIELAPEFIDNKGQVYEFIHHKPSTVTQERMLELSHRAHIAIFGDFYTGSTDATRAWQKSLGKFSTAESDQGYMRALRPLGFWHKVGEIPSKYISGSVDQVLQNLSQHNDMNWFQSAVPTLKEYLSGKGLRVTVSERWGDTLKNRVIGGSVTENAPAEFQMDALRRAAVERIKFFEQALADLGIRVRMGAELEFVPLNEQGFPEPNLLDENGLTRQLRQFIPTIERVHREPGSQVVYELVTGPNRHMPGTGLADASPLATADTLAGFKEAVQANAPRWGLSGVSFAPAVAAGGFSEKNGTHLNISLWSADGVKNLFYDPSGKETTDLQRHVIDALIRSHAEGTAAYLPHPSSYTRLAPLRIDYAKLYGALLVGPNRAGHMPNKGADFSYAIGQIQSVKETQEIPVNSVASRYGGGIFERFTGLLDWIYYGPNRSSMIGWEKPDQYRIESRLAGADIDPYVLVAMELGAAYEAVIKHVRPYNSDRPIDLAKEKVINVGDKEIVVDIHNGKFDSVPLPRDLDTARNQIVSNERLRGLLGDDFYHGIIAYTDPENHPDRRNIGHHSDLRATGRQHEVQHSMAKLSETIPLITTIHDVVNKTDSPVRAPEERGFRSVWWGKAISGIAEVTGRPNLALHSPEGALPQHLITSRLAIQSGASNGLGVAMGMYGLYQKFNEIDGTFQQDIESADAVRRAGAVTSVALDGANILAGAVSTADDMTTVRTSSAAPRIPAVHPVAPPVSAPAAPIAAATPPPAPSAPASSAAADDAARLARTGGQVEQAVAQGARGSTMHAAGRMAGRAAIPLAVAAGGAETFVAVRAGDRERATGAVGGTLGGIFGGLAVGAGAGALMGAATGSVVPGVGTITVGVVAGVAGGIGGAIVGEQAAQRYASRAIGWLTGIDRKIRDAMKDLDPRLRPFLDANHDGTVSINEVHALLARGNLGAISRIDANGDGTLSGAELNQALTSVVIDQALSATLPDLRANGLGGEAGSQPGNLTLAELKAAFPEGFDFLNFITSNNGRISASEIIQALHASAPPTTPPVPSPQPSVSAGVQ